MVFCLCLAVMGPLAAEDGEESLEARLAAAWKKTTLLDFGGAYSDFQRLAAVDDSAVAREARYGMGVNLLSIQPVTPGRMELAGEILESVRSEDANDALGIGAWYYLGRLDTVHRPTPNTARGVATLMKLADAHPDEFFGQMALLNCLIIELFDTQPNGPIEEIAAPWEERLPAVTNPYVRRNYLQALANFHTRFPGSLEKGYRYLAEADAIGFSRFDITYLAVIRLYRMAHELGFRVESDHYLKRFIEENPRHPQTAFFQQVLDGEMPHPTLPQR